MDSATIIIPVKDEEVGLDYLYRDFGESKIADFIDVEFIFIVDHRTSDSSREVARKLSDNVIDQAETTGKGAAIKQAVEKWKSEPTKYAIFLDADGSYSFSSVMDVISHLRDGADVVSGSRFLHGSGSPEGMSRLHGFGNRFLSKLSSIRNRKKISDLCTGLWGFKLEALNKIEISSTGFDLEAELFGQCRRKGLSHVESPVEWSQRKGGVSKLRSMRDGFIILMRIIRT